MSGLRGAGRDDVVPRRVKQYAGMHLFAPVLAPVGEKGCEECQKLARKSERFVSHQLRALLCWAPISFFAFAARNYAQANRLLSPLLLEDLKISRQAPSDCLVPSARVVPTSNIEWLNPCACAAPGQARGTEAGLTKAILSNSVKNRELIAESPEILHVQGLPRSSPCLQIVPHEHTAATPSLHRLKPSMWSSMLAHAAQRPATVFVQSRLIGSRPDQSLPLRVTTPASVACSAAIAVKIVPWQRRPELETMLIDLAAHEEDAKRHEFARCSSLLPSALPPHLIPLAVPTSTRTVLPQLRAVAAQHLEWKLRCEHNLSCTRSAATSPRPVLRVRLLMLHADAALSLPLALALVRYSRKGSAASPIRCTLRGCIRMNESQPTVHSKRMRGARPSR
ncbi:hypothetical protein DFH07DRAFT_769578 [Mycena maculata]|uniref:Uncharacterized protein n=1 Tax=Mycena maculata TaxID=230809 RepID=A0AAD7NMQ5_9AGAR|nr:hypothetical protein DFH07DRAFT_769578 [Mycena maculata]